jgi:UDP:flavonoid glycosyltransferase YjiC (YdhE family)
MATILLTWELGSGIGHLMRLRQIGQALVERGHRVIAAARDLTRIREYFSGTGISYVAAPWIAHDRPVYSPMRSFAHILANVGFSDESALATVFAAWNTLFDCVRPDLVITDHSPQALLALHERPIPRANIGLGFFCPPDGFPLPYWLTGRDKVHAPQTIEDERMITGHVNRVLQAHHREPLNHLGQIYRAVDETFLATYEEFDHFGPRQRAVRYWGHWPFFPGEPPRWPAGAGPKIYAYLKSFPALGALLGQLRRMGHPAILLGIEPKLQKQYAAPNLRFAPRPLDLRAVAQQCDLAILNAGHGTAVSLLLAGKPCLLLPLFTEQLLFAQKVQKLKAGKLADNGGALEVARALKELLEDTRYGVAARHFAAKYATFKPGEQLMEIVDHLERLARH